MLATFVIGLREGLEAALIVGILAAFLRRNGASLVPLWIGTLSAAALSLVVGIALDLVSASLPQRAQEGMESIISAIAVVFVTMMIVWMNTHARGMKAELESHAGAAIAAGTAWAIGLMAFLAVLREGFELAVFLLATFQSSVSVTGAVLGAVLGLAGAILLGIGIYHGGVRFNLARFFKITGVFLVLVAGGLVITTLRTAHEAGWVNIGQARTVDLSWLAPPGSIQAALLTGVLGIPADPRVIEVVGWLCYVVPMLVIVLWPAARRPTGAAKVRLQLGLAAGLGVAALALALVPSVPAYAAPGPAPLVAAVDDPTAVGEASVTGSALVLSPTGSTAPTTVPLDGLTWTADTHSGVAAQTAAYKTPPPTGLPSTLTLAQLTTLNGGRIPVGVSPATAPGPYDAAWSISGGGQVWLATGDVLLDVTQDTTVVLTLSGGGLQTTRTLTVDQAVDGVVPTAVASPSYVEQISTGVDAVADEAEERALWNRWLPLVGILAALALLTAALRNRRRLTADNRAPPEGTGTPDPTSDSPRRSINAA